jgi:hypothetical protein
MISPSGHPSLKKGGESYLIEFLLNIIQGLKLILKLTAMGKSLPPIQIAIGMGRGFAE